MPISRATQGLENSVTMALAYPMSAIVGHAETRRALMALAIDPELRGVLIASAPGTAKTTLARSFASLIGAGCPFVEIPINVTEDRLIGGLNVDATVASGSRKVSCGLLAAANGGIVYVDSANLLEPSAAQIIASAVDSGIVRVEREGISLIQPARFRLIATYDPAEGGINPLLKDRLGLILFPPALDGLNDRTDVLERYDSFQHSRSEFLSRFEAETEALRSTIEQARLRLPAVRITKEQIANLIIAARELRVEGNRADIVAVRAARAAAALDGAEQVSDDHLIWAIRTVLAARATRGPSDTQPPPPPEPKSREDASSPNDSELSPDHSEFDPAHQEPDSTASNTDPIEEMILQAIDSALPEDALNINLQRVAGPRSRTQTSGKRGRRQIAAKGRYSGAVEYRRGSPVAIDATLRAAAPYQGLRRASSDRHSKHVILKAADLRAKQFKKKSGVLYIFVVDASGSMALGRLAQAKGALMRILQSAYIHRDQVSVISFAGSGARLLLSPTGSIALASQAIQALPAGGGTPLAAGLVEAIKVARIARLKSKFEVMLLIFTDGRVNVGLSSTGEIGSLDLINAELRALGNGLAAESINTVLIDTRPPFLADSQCPALARTLGARYVYLPRANPAKIVDVVKSLQ